jgi:methyl-accepting chemotaxis protein
MKLSKFRISTKILAVIAVLAISCITVAWTSWTGLTALRDAAEEIDMTASEIRIGARINRLVAELNREEYHLAASPNVYDEAAAAIKERRARIVEGMAEARATAGPRQQKLLAAAEKELAEYLAALEKTLQVAQRHRGSVDLSRQQQEVLQSVESSRDAARDLRTALTAYVEYTDNKGSEISQQASATADLQIKLLVTVATIGILVGLLLGWVVSQYGIVKPMQAIVACLRKLSDGDLQTEIYGLDRKDEVGTIATTAQIFKENLVRTRRMEEEAKEAEERARAERRQAMLDLAARFEQSVGSVVRAVGSSATELEATSTQLASVVEEAGAQTAAVATASEQASANVQTVASASEEMSSAINEVAQRVAQAASRSKSAADGAHTAQQHLDALTGAIDAVNQVVAAINNVAEQTNLLALNATIEAARAGEAGKGFAVVASEVKSLANQTRRMTDQVGDQIAAVMSSSTRTVEAMRAILQQVSEINESTTEMAASIEEQSAATNEISRNVQQAAVGTQEVASNVVGIKDAVLLTAEATNNVKASASDLAEQASMLKREVDNFLDGVRAA